MSNYFIKNDKPNAKYLVTEQESELVIKKFMSYDDARKFTKHLNGGGAFAGHTPPFMVKSNG